MMTTINQRVFGCSIGRPLAIRRVRDIPLRWSLWLVTMIESTSQPSRRQQPRPPCGSKASASGPRKVASIGRRTKLRTEGKASYKGCFLLQKRRWGATMCVEREGREDSAVCGLKRWSAQKAFNLRGRFARQGLQSNESKLPDPCWAKRIEPSGLGVAQRQGHRIVGAVDQKGRRSGRNSSSFGEWKGHSSSKRKQF